MGSVQAADSAVLLVYGFLAAFISGIIAFQVVIDWFISWRSRYITITIWHVPDLTDALNIIIPLTWYLKLTVAATAIQTLFVQCLFAKEIHKYSNQNWSITAPILVLSFIQLAAASVSTFEMIRLQHFPAFHQPYPSLIFVASLSLSVVVDLLITGWLYYFLRSLQREIGLPSRPIRLLTYFTLWFVVPTKPVYFIALYFLIGKLYLFISFLPMGGLRMQMWDLREKRNAWGDLIPRSEEFDASHQPWKGEFMYYPRGDIRQLEVIINETVEYGEHVRGIRNEYYSPYSDTQPSPGM
ncbi:uncharacterized protein ARMOST_18885 [Armillaria ostoyae]|uniref:Uncharacterized protein n=1 Tax=Armillaria ostoyae TaxID=47428 RepID=A0A284S321_ARMOS|nr:uncharacterized protein ARMOST_18885 [Armillaria ostoyae]